MALSLVSNFLPWDDPAAVANDDPGAMELTTPRWLRRVDPNDIPSHLPGNPRLPGPWVGGVALVAGPVLLLIGTFLRIGYHFFYPDQLRAFVEAPGLINASYNCWLAGNILLWPAVLALANRIGQTRPGWAVWGATLVITGLFARAYHYGSNFLAFQLVEHQGLPAATAFVSAAYRDTSFQAVRFLSFTIMFGWYVLAVATYLSRTLGAIRSVCLASMSLLPLGILKGTETMTVLGVIGLCIALLPAGREQLRQAVRDTAKPRRAQVGLGLLTTAAVLTLAISGNYG